MPCLQNHAGCRDGHGAIARGVGTITSLCQLHREGCAGWRLYIQPAGDQQHASCCYGSRICSHTDGCRVSPARATSGPRPCRAAPLRRCHRLVALPAAGARATPEACRQAAAVAETPHGASRRLGSGKQTPGQYRCMPHVSSQCEHEPLRRTFYRVSLSFDEAQRVACCRRAPTRAAKGYRNVPASAFGRDTTSARQGNMCAGKQYRVTDLLPQKRCRHPSLLVKGRGTGWGIMQQRC